MFPTALALSLMTNSYHHYPIPWRTPQSLGRFRANEIER
jgi:hypothetical protein